MLAPKMPTFLPSAAARAVATASATSPDSSVIPGSDTSWSSRWVRTNTGPVQAPP
jgi:hypothetical protein